MSACRPSMWFRGTCAMGTKSCRTHHNAQPETVSVKSEVHGAPSLAWRYCVEVPDKDNPKGDPTGKWRYTTTWETEYEAVSYAKTVKGPVRVRSYKVQHFPADHAIAPDVFTASRSDAPMAPIVEYICPTHQDFMLGVTGEAPACRHCGATMVKPKFAKALATAKDWT